MLLFILAVLVYTIALAGISQLTSNTSYLPLLRCVCFIFGAFACDLLLLILVTPFGWFILILCVCMSVRLLCDSHRQILECFQQIYQLINQSTSKAFNILCSWFQKASTAFNSSSMPIANSMETLPEINA